MVGPDPPREDQKWVVVIVVIKIVILKFKTI